MHVVTLKQFGWPGKVIKQEKVLWKNSLRSKKALKNYWVPLE